MRVPKTGSNSVIALLAELAGRNGFGLTAAHAPHASRYYGGDVKRLGPAGRRAVALRLGRRTALFGHIAFYHFGGYLASRPALISVVREPMARFASSYYYSQCRTNATQLRKRARWHTEPKRAYWLRDNGTATGATLDECVREGGGQCGPRRMWLQVPYFCGQAPQCWQVGSQWALAEAKHNLANHFLLVGLTERMKEFAQLMQIILPEYFAHADEYLHNNKIVHANPGGGCKKEMSLATKAVLSKWPAYQMEYELYKFASELFEDTHKRTLAVNLTNSDNLFQLEFRSKITSQ